MVLKGLIAMPEKVLGDRWADAATRTLAQAEKKLETLLSVTKVNRIMSLRGDIERSRFAQQATAALLELELAREARLRAKVAELQAQTAAAAKPLAVAPELKAGSHVHEGQVLRASSLAPIDQSPALTFSERAEKAAAMDCSTFSAAAGSIFLSADKAWAESPGSRPFESSTSLLTADAAAEPHRP